MTTSPGDNPIAGQTDDIRYHTLADPHRQALMLSDVILGGQDGLVNVAGIILGLAAATSDVRIIIAGGLAATFAESISMAAVAYTSAMADKDYYAAELSRAKDEIRLTPDKKRQQLAGLFRSWGFDGRLLDEAVDHLSDLLCDLGEPWAGLKGEHLLLLTHGLTPGKT